MADDIEYWKELMAVFRQARGHYAQIVSFSLATIVAALAIVYRTTDDEGKLVLFLIVTLAAGGVTYMHLIFLHELKALRKQMLKVQPKIDDGKFDITLALKNTLLTSSIIFVIIFVGVLFLTLEATFSLVPP